MLRLLASGLVAAIALSAPLAAQPSTAVQVALQVANLDSQKVVDALEQRLARVPGVKSVSVEVERADVKLPGRTVTLTMANASSLHLRDIREALLAAERDVHGTEPRAKGLALDDAGLIVRGKVRLTTRLKAKTAEATKALLKLEHVLAARVVNATTGEFELVTAAVEGVTLASLTKTLASFKASKPRGSGTRTVAADLKPVVTDLVWTSPDLRRRPKGS